MEGDIVPRVHIVFQGAAATASHWADSLAPPCWRALAILNLIGQNIRYEFSIRELSC